MATTSKSGPRRLARAEVMGDSMMPLLADGDWLLVVEDVPVRRGELVVARQPDQPGRRIVKRAAHNEGDGWWLLGINPSASDDSRTFGVVANDWIEGVVIARYWPRPRVLLSPWRAANLTSAAGWYVGKVLVRRLPYRL